VSGEGEIADQYERQARIDRAQVLGERDSALTGSRRIQQGHVEVTRSSV
jgi:hypothetical protein